MVLDLGATPLANSLLKDATEAAREQRFPLRLAVCETCSLAQITDIVPPEVLFKDYVYFSSFSDALLRHAKSEADTLKARKTLGPSSLVVEIASNDGYLLKNFVAAGIPVLGIEPASNIAKVAVENGIRTVNEFFTLPLAEKLVADGVRADYILANNVMAHIPVINEVIRGIASLLKDDGLFVMETPYLVDMVSHLEFDTIYHEHVFCYSLTALRHLFERNGLTIVDVQKVAIHGGTIRVYGARTDGSASRTVAPAVTDMLRAEHDAGVDTIAYYREFQGRVQALCADLVALLRRLKGQGKRIAAYGASAKGSTLLNYCGIGGDLLDYVVDRSTVKQGKLTPGSHLPIHAAEKLLDDKPDYVLLLTWNFAEEILAQQDAYRRAGGKFIVPIPKLAVV